MHPYSVTFHTSDDLLFKIISILLSLFIVGTWLYNSNHVKFIWRAIFAVIGGFGSYFVALLFFGVLQFSYNIVEDNYNPDKQLAKIVKYEKFVGKSTSRSEKSSGSRTRKNTFYRPLLEYSVKNGTLKRAFGDVSFSANNFKAIGEKVEVIIENSEVRMISPIKNFTFLVNTVMLCFLFLFYYLFYNYAKTQDFEMFGMVAMILFGYIIFPLAFVILTYLLLNIGFEYFFQNKRYTGRNAAMLLSGLGIFLALCFFGYMRMLVENLLPKRKKKKRNKKI